MNKERLKILLRFVILFGLHYFWLRMCIYFIAITQSLGDVSPSIDAIANYYLTTWWPIPATAVVVNLINILFAKLVPIESKSISRFYWILSMMMTLLFIFPYILNLGANLIWEYTH